MSKKRKQEVHSFSNHLVTMVAVVLVLYITNLCKNCITPTYHLRVWYHLVCTYIMTYLFTYSAEHMATVTGNLRHTHTHRSITLHRVSHCVITLELCTSKLHPSLWSGHFMHWGIALTPVCKNKHKKKHKWSSIKSVT